MAAHHPGAQSSPRGRQRPRPPLPAPSRAQERHARPARVPEQLRPLPRGQWPWLLARHHLSHPARQSSGPEGSGAPLGRLHVQPHQARRGHHRPAGYARLRLSSVGRRDARAGGVRANALRRALSSPLPEESPMTTDLLETIRDGVAVLTMNRPDRLNALSGPMLDAMLEALHRLAEDNEVGAVVLTGAGRGFCAGGDVKAMAEGTEFVGTMEEKAQALRSRMETSRLLHEMPKPTIAMVRGAAAGAGLSLALACDLRVASDNA